MAKKVTKKDDVTMDSTIETIMGSSQVVNLEQVLSEQKALEAAQLAAEKEAFKAAKKAERRAKKEAVEAEKPVKEPKPALIEQNSVKRPNSTGKTGQVWNLADKLSSEKGSPVSIAELRAETDKYGANTNMVSTQYAAWKKFHGIAGRIVGPKSDNNIAKLQAAYDEAYTRLLKAEEAYKIASDALVVEVVLVVE